MARKIVPILIVAAAVAAGAWWYLQQGEAAGPELGGSGTIEGTTAEVTPRIAGRIVAIHADQGDRVERDAVLVELSHEELDEQLAQVQAAVETADAMIAAARDQERLARTNLRHAQAETRRARDLQASGSLSRQTLDAAINVRDSLRAQVAAAHSQVAAAEAQRAQAEAQGRFVERQIENATLTCPLDGIVLHRNLEVGENAFPGSSVLTVVDDRNLWVKIYVSEATLGRVRVGMPARVTVDTFADRIFEGTVTYVSPVAEFTPRNVQTREERVRLVFAVKVRVDGSGGELKAGMPADVELVEQQG